MFNPLLSILSLVAFLLLLLVSLSVPIITSISIFRLSAHFNSNLLNSDLRSSVIFGIWGYCISSVELSILGSTKKTSPKCSPTRLGYTVDDTVANALHADGLQHLISRTATAALVLHPIAAGLAFLLLLISLSFIRRGLNNSSKWLSLMALGVGILAAILTTIVFLIDVIVVAIARHKVNHDFDGNLILNWGNAVWMALGAAVALWLAIVAICSGMCSCGRRNRTDKF